MSDPVTNAEVEDVLSSIRRLVSEDKRPLQVAQGDKINDRLVLTPALRVAEDHVGKDQNDDPHDGNGSDSDSGDYRAEQSPVRSEYDDAAEVRRDAAVSMDQAIENAGSEAADFDDPAHDYAADPYNFDDESDHDGESNAAQFVDVQHINDEHREPTENADVPSEIEEFDNTEHKDDVEAASFEDHEASDVQDDSSEQNAPSEDQAQSPTGKADALRAKITELEAAIGSIAGNWDVHTDAPEMHPVQSEDAMAWEDASPEDAITSKLHVYDPEADAADEGNLNLADTPDEAREPAAETDHTQEGTAAAVDPVEPKVAAPIFDFGDDAQMIDEEALRDLVGEIVRAELQGDLGERITRNVRKLVRREIHRALTAQDLE